MSVAAGPLSYYPIIPHFQVYIGASAMGSYVHLHTTEIFSTIRSENNVKSLKPGLLAKAGFFFPIRKGFRIPRRR